MPYISMNFHNLVISYFSVNCHISSNLHFIFWGYAYIFSSSFKQMYQLKTNFLFFLLLFCIENSFMPYMSLQLNDDFFPNQWLRWGGGSHYFLMPP